MDGESHLAQLSVDHQFNGDWSAHLGYSYNRETYDANQLRTTGVDPVKGTLSRSNDATHGSLSTDSYGIGYVNGKLTLAGMRHDVQVGFDTEYRRIYRKDMLRQAVKTPFSYVDPCTGCCRRRARCRRPTATRPTRCMRHRRSCRTRSI